MAIDQRALENLRELDPDGSSGVFAQLVAAYLRSAAALLEQMQTALAANDGVSLTRHAHTLKSTSATLGATRVSEIARELESFDKGGDIGVCSLFFNALLAEHAVAAMALRAACTPAPLPTQAVLAR
jgi:HPt (histidine-containing phosphotransfer) domain-containing protein